MANYNRLNQANNSLVTRFLTKPRCIVLGIVLYTIFMFFMMKRVYQNGESTPDSEYRSLENSDFDASFIIEQQKEIVELNSLSQKFNSSSLKKPPTNSVIVILAKNSDLTPLRKTIREFEDRFNKQHHYPYVILNDSPFTEEFKYYLSSSVHSKVEFGLINKEHWSIPSFVDKDKVATSMETMKNNGVMYGEKLSYHHMCRYYSGFFMHHELLQKYDYYWRVEPNVHFFCEIDYDPFLFMEQNKKDYAFVIALKELESTIPSLWKETIKYAKMKNLDTQFLKFFANNEDNYNLCHFWSNFEIASFKFMRSKQYQDYFNYLDKTGNFFYERWGDAPVHSLALGLFLNKTQIHFFDSIGYQHDDFFHCPDVQNNEMYNKKCLCPSGESFDNTYFSCLPRFKTYKDEKWSFKKEN